MSEFHCLDIEFPDVDFSPYYIKSKKKIDKIHHAHLFARTDEIELRIFYDDESYFGEKLSVWSDSIDYKKFGSFIKVEATENHTNESIQKIDISEAKLCDLSNGPEYYEGDKKYVIVKIDTVKFYWNPNEEKKNTAEFYIDEKGFRVVEPFYGGLRPKSLFENDGKFEINRRNDSNKFYELGISTFRPEFNFISKNKRKERTATITKEPKFQFKYNEGITVKEAIFYGDVVLMLVSFYHHIKIDYTLRRIHLPENTITIKNIEEKNYLDRNGGLRGFGIIGGLNKFFELSWQKETVKNFELLSKAITLFNQSLLVDNSSAFLIRYNIIEICGKTSIDNGIWNFTLKNDELDKFFSVIRESISNIIDATEQEHFNNKWNSIQNIIKSKSLRKQLEDSLTKNDINVESLPIRTSKIVQLRNSITHGSLDKVNNEDLRKANILLYRICGILILNLMGIKDWKLNTEIK
jgi:hypothetical protein